MNYRKETKNYIEEQKRLGKVVVMATGCFDILTNAHVKFLKRARQAGDVLVVGLEDDSRVKKFKGHSRPVNTISQRVELMEALEFVDFVFVIKGAVYDDLKPYYTHLHKFIKADILAVSEGDPHLNDRREEIEAAGGKLSIVCTIEDGSTTSIIQKFLDEAEYKNLIIFSREDLNRLFNKGETNWRQLRLPFD